MAAKNIFINPLNINTMSAKQQAVRDIREALAKANKAFIAFHSELNPIMRELVREQLEAQKSLNKRKHG